MEFNNNDSARANNDSARNNFKTGAVTIFKTITE